MAFYNSSQSNSDAFNGYSDNDGVGSSGDDITVDSTESVVPFEGFFFMGLDWSIMLFVLLIVISAVTTIGNGLVLFVVSSLFT